MRLPNFVYRILFLYLQSWLIKLITPNTHRLSYSKEVCDLADRPYTRVLIQSQFEDGEKYWIAYHPEIRGCHTQGSTPAHAMWMLDDARHLMIEVLLEDGRPIPEPQSDYDYVDKNGLIIDIKPGFECWDDPYASSMSVGTDMTYTASFEFHDLSSNLSLKQV